MKIIDLLNKIANDEEVPKAIEYDGIIYKKADIGEDYFNFEIKEWFFKDVFDASGVNLEIKTRDEEDIPLIPDDELNICGQSKIDYNFKVLKEKINQVVEELNKRSDK